MELSMATRHAITKAQATRYRSGSRAVKTEILDFGVRGDRVQPGLRPPGVEAGAEAAGNASAGTAGAEVRREGRCGAGEVLGGGERAGREAARAYPSRIGAGAAPVGRAGH